VVPAGERRYMGGPSYTADKLSRLSQHVRMNHGPGMSVCNSYNSWLLRLLRALTLYQSLDANFWTRKRVPSATNVVLLFLGLLLSDFQSTKAFFISKPNVIKLRI